MFDFWLGAVVEFKFLTRPEKEMKIETLNDWSEQNNDQPFSLSLANLT